ncbi:MAG: hypothetical protein HHAS10_06240 [Candidatus Altimarinota bacterium]
MPSTNLICQVGFGYKQDPDHIYYHEKDGELLGFQVTLPDEEELLDPFTVDDLVTGQISFELLPQSIKELMMHLAERTFGLIQVDNPKESELLDPMDIEACFHRRESAPTLN